MQKVTCPNRLLEIEIEDKSYKIKFPTALQVSAYLKDLLKISKGESESNEVDLTLDLLIELGLPKDVAILLEMDDLEEITNVLTTKKKKMTSPEISN